MKLQKTLDKPIHPSGKKNATNSLPINLSSPIFHDIPKFKKHLTFQYTYKT